MKKSIILLSLFSFIISYTIKGQEAKLNPMLNSYLNEKEVAKRIKNKDFRDFLHKFYSLPLPLNMTKAMNQYYFYFPDNVSKTRHTIDDKYMIQFFNLKKADFIDTYIDEDSGIKVNRKESYWAKQSYFLNHKLIVVIFSDSKFGGALKKEYISVLDNDGKLISKEVIYKRTNSYTTMNLVNKSDLEDMTLFTEMSYVLVDKNHFKTYRYDLNEANVKEKGEFERYVKYIDKTAPKSKCTITEYEITNEGQIKKLKVYPPVLLKNEPWDYTKDLIKPNENLDDPINEY